MSARDHDLIGVNWKDVGKNAFGVLHTGGKTVASFFGAGQLAQALEEIEAGAGLLPDWARTPPAKPKNPRVTVSGPDFVVAIHEDASGRRAAKPYARIRTAVVEGGTRFSGGGWKRGDRIGASFSFGYDKPVAVEVTDTSGRRFTVTDARQVVFLGGAESDPVVGDDGFIEIVEGDVLGWSLGDTMLAIFTGGLSLPASTAKDSKNKSRTRVKLTSHDVKESEAYKVAFGRLRDAQARLDRAKTAREKYSYSTNKVSIPSFTLSVSPGMEITRGASFLLSEPTFSLTTSPMSSDPSSAEESESMSTVSGDDGEQQALAEAEVALARAEVEAAPEAAPPPGGPKEALTAVCTCPKCRVALRLVVDARAPGVAPFKKRPVATGPTKKRVLGSDDGFLEILGSDNGFLEILGSDDGFVEIVGKLATRRPLGAAAAKDVGCVCTCDCPQCGTRLCVVLRVAAEEKKVPGAPASPGWFSRLRGKIAADYVVGSAVVGAPPPPRKPAKTAKKPAGVAPGKSKHKAALVRTAKVVLRADAVAKAAITKAKSYKPGALKTVIPLKPTTVRGEIVLGTDQKLTARQQAAVQKHTKTLTVAAKAVQKTAAAGQKAKKSAETAAAALKKAKPIVDKLMKKSVIMTPARKSTNVRGLDDDVLGMEIEETFPLVIPDVDESPGYHHSGEEEIIGTMIEDVLGEQEEIVGLLVEDFDDVQIVGQEEDVPLDFADEGDIPLPERDVPLSTDEAQTTWHKVPEDGVKYDNSRGLPSGSIGSANVWYGSGTGLFYGSSETGVDTHWWVRHNDLGWYLKKGSEWGDPDGWEKMSVEQAAQAAASGNFGPLVGAPSGPLKNIQYAVDDKQWFWQSSHAPKWASEEQDKQITLLNQKSQAAKQAAAEADAARRAQEEAERAEAQAKQDAENALAQSAADTQSKIAEQAAQAQERQAGIEKSRIETQMAAEKARLDAQREAQREQSEAQKAAREAEQAARESEFKRQQAAEQARLETEEKRAAQAQAAEQARLDAQQRQFGQQQDADQARLETEAQRAYLEWAKNLPTQPEPPQQQGGGDAWSGGAQVDWGGQQEQVNWGSEEEQQIDWGSATY